MRRAHVLTALPLLACVFALTIVGAGPTLAASAIDPCVLVTAADVEAALGAAVTESFSNPGECTYFLEYQTAPSTVRVQAAFQPSVSVAKGLTTLANKKSDFQGDPEKVKGVGQQAIYKPPRTFDDGSSTSQVLQARKGKLIVIITGGLGQEPSKAALVKLAKGAFANL